MLLVGEKGKDSKTKTFISYNRSNNLSPSRTFRTSEQTATPFETITIETGNEAHATCERIQTITQITVA